MTEEQIEKLSQDSVTETGELSFDELCERLCEPGRTVILFHRSPDADAVGSAFALRMVLEELGSEAFCLCESEVPERLRFLMHGMQESVLPTALPTDFAPVRVVSVDSASPAQLGTLYSAYEKKIALAIDHHAKGERYAAQSYVRAEAAATGEILFDIVKELATAEKIRITEELCTNLYAAISADTGCFRFSNVTPETHLRAAELLASGIDCAEINHRLYECKTMDQLRAEAAGISNLNLFCEGRVAVITFPYALKAALGLPDESMETLVDIARSLYGVEVAVCIRQPAAEGRFRVSTRSNGAYDVGALCAGFDGGGHAKAAGCTILAADINEAMKRIVTAIRLPDEEE